MIVGYIFSRDSKLEFPIVAEENNSIKKQRQECEDYFYAFLRESLLAKMLSIEDC